MVHNTPSAALGSVVATELEQAGLSLRDAADVVGIPRTTLKRRLDFGGFTVPERERIASLLEVSVSALVAKAEDAA